MVGNVGLDVDLFDKLAIEDIERCQHSHSNRHCVCVCLFVFVQFGSSHLLHMRVDSSLRHVGGGCVAWIKLLHLGDHGITEALLS